MEIVTSLVPCGQCTLCCHGEVVVLHPEAGDDPSLFRTEPFKDPTQAGRLTQRLLLAENGDCTHLIEGKCEVYDHRPAMCRAFDCRAFYRSRDRAARRRMERQSPATGEILRRGRELIAQERAE